MNNLSINPINCFIDSNRILKDPSKPLTACLLIGVSLYKGECVTGIIKLKDGTVFSYIPFHSLRIYDSDVALEEASHEDIKLTHFINAPSINGSVSYLEELKGDVSFIYNPSKGYWKEGRYVLTLDFVDDNELLNLIITNEGLFVWRPFHKMKFINLLDSDFTKEVSNFKKQPETYFI